MLPDPSNGHSTESHSVDAICCSLIKEFLVRRGLKSTLAAFSQECKSAASGLVLSSRKELAQTVGMEEAMKRNKNSSRPLSTIMEVLVRSLRQKPTAQQPAQASRITRSHPLAQSFTLPHDSIQPDAEPSEVSSSKQETFSSHLSNGAPQHQPAPSHFTKAAGASDTVPEKETLELFIPTSHTQPICLEDLDELDLNPLPSSHAPLAAPPVRVAAAAHPISHKDAVSLRTLAFGTACGRSFNQEWRRQGFFFCDLPGLEFGLTQLKGGPCGLLAVLQAHVLKFLLFQSEQLLEKSLRPSNALRRSALRHSMEEILWRAGGQKRACVLLASPSPHLVSDAGYKCDQLTEHLQVHEVRDRDSLSGLLEQHLQEFAEERPGCILLLYSALLSRGLSAVQRDMDPGSQLIGAHGYCSQELVNLLLTGHAVSNVFNGDLQLNSGGDSSFLLKGVPSQSEVGLLSLFEHYGSCTVGSHLKEPALPIWVVCSESHFTVLFNTNRKLLRDWRLEKKFDLFYYDGLSRQEELIRLTVETGSALSPVRNSALTPPLELCIRTKWRRAVVDWNGTDPIL